MVCFSPLQLRALAEKVQALEQHKQTSTAAHVGEEEWGAREAALHSQYAGRMHKYQQAVKAMATREPELTAALNKVHSFSFRFLFRHSGDPRLLCSHRL